MNGAAAPIPKELLERLLDTEKIKLPKAEIHIIKNRCKGCGFCIEFCPKEVLETSEELNEKGFHPPKVKDENKCTLCGFCVAVCPDFAIFTVEKDCEGGC